MLLLVLGFGLMLAFALGVSAYLIAQENQEIAVLRAEREEILGGRRV